MRLWVRTLVCISGGIIAGLGTGYFINEPFTSLLHSNWYHIYGPAPLQLRVYGTVKLLDTEKKILVIETRNPYDNRTPFILEVFFGNDEHADQFARLHVGSRIRFLLSRKSGVLTVAESSKLIEY